MARSPSVRIPPAMGTSTDLSRFYFNKVCGSAGCSLCSDFFSKVGGVFFLSAKCLPKLRPNLPPWSVISHYKHCPPVMSEAAPFQNGL